MYKSNVYVVILKYANKFRFNKIKYIDSNLCAFCLFEPDILPRLSYTCPKVVEFLNFREQTSNILVNIFNLTEISFCSVLHNLTNV